MRSNRGHTTLKRVRRPGCPMRDYDKLPRELREWMSTAILPWRARSVQMAFDKALARTGDRLQALAELDRLQEALVSKDANRIWGVAHPNAGQSA